MLSPKEKAIQLIAKYSTYVVMWAGDVETTNQNVKQCAIIAVDEIIKCYNWPSSELKYWNDTKTEIINL